MGGTLSSIYNNTIFALNLHSKELARLQEQVTTGSRINRTSDEPTSAYRILGLNSQARSLANYIDNLSQTVDILTLTSTTLSNITSTLADVKKLLSSITGTSEGALQGITSQGINEAIEKLVAAANTRHMNRYLFGGGNTATAPYAVVRDENGKITSVTYQGSFEDRNIEVAPGVEGKAFYIGDELFRSDNRSDPVFSGDTGAASGTGTSSVKGDIWLTVSGTAGNWTLSIDGGLSSVNSNGTETNLAVTNSQTGEVLYVDATGITTAGTDWVRVPGTYNIFDALISICDRMETEGISYTDIEELRNNGLASLDEVNGLLAQKSVSIGSKIGFLSNIKDSLTNVQYNTEDEVARLEEADIAQLAVDLSRTEVLYQMTLSISARLLSMSLLDFIG
jgi:flagellar hook-associated protein 3 FlgL